MEPEAGTEEYAGIEAKFYYDTDAECPYRAWDTLGTVLVPSSSRWAYDEKAWAAESLGYAEDAIERRGIAAGARYLTLMGGYAAAVAFRVENYREGRLFVLDSDDEFLQGRDVGSAFVVCTLERARELGVADETREGLEAALRAELEGDVSSWVEGDVFGYVVAEGTDDEEALWGLYGRYWAEEAAKEACEAIAEDRIRRSQDNAGGMGAWLRPLVSS